MKNKCVFENDSFCSYFNRDMGSRDTEYLCENCECFISTDPIMREAMKSTIMDKIGILFFKKLLTNV